MGFILVSPRRSLPDAALAREPAAAGGVMYRGDQEADVVLVDAGDGVAEGDLGGTATRWRADKIGSVDTAASGTVLSMFLPRA
jgi:hypothetical protein